MKRLIVFLFVGCAAALAGAQNLGTSPAYYLRTTGAPAQTCSASSYNGVFAVSEALNWYQCSNNNVGATYVWNLLTPAGGGSGLPQCADTSGSGTAQSCTTSPTFTPAAGDCISYSTTTANTGSSLTLNVNSSSTAHVAKWLGTTTLAAGDVAAGKPVVACYDSTNWELSTIANAPSGGSSFPSGGSEFAVNNNANSPAVTPNMTYDQAQQSTNMGSPTSIPKGLLVLASFGGQTGGTCCDGSDIDALYISTSTDGINWQIINTGYTGISGAGVRDPSITKIGQIYYVAFSDGSLGESAAAFGLAYSYNLTDWTSIGAVTITGTNAMTSYVWAPEFYIENPGCTTNAGTDNDGYTCAAAQKVHVFYADSASGNSAHKVYQITANTVPLTVTGWGNAAGTANDADLVFSGGSGDAIDPFVVRNGTSEWDLFFENLAGCTGSSTAACGIQYASATTVAGTYTQVTSGNWTGNMAGGGGTFEGPNVRMVGTDSSGNNIWRLSTDENASQGGVGDGLVFMQANAAAGTAFDSMTWQSVGTSGTNYLAQLNPPIGPFAGTTDGYTGAYHHGTYIRLMDVDSMRDVAAALMQQSRDWSVLPPTIANSTPNAMFSFSSGAKSSNDISFEFNNTQSAHSFMQSGVFLAGNMASGDESFMDVGNDTGCDDWAYFGFHFNSENDSTNNYGSLGINCGSDLMTWWANGNIGVGYTHSTGAPSKLFSVNGTEADVNHMPVTLYSAAGTAVPTCNSGAKGMEAEVSDATTPTYMSAYSSGGAITAAVICSYNGTTYSWLTH